MKSRAVDGKPDSVGRPTRTSIYKTKDHAGRVRLARVIGQQLLCWFKPYGSETDVESPLLVMVKVPAEWTGV